MSEIFVITGGEQLVPLAQEAYASEDLLQVLLAKYPNLLAGDQITPGEPRRWLLVKREAAIPDQQDAAGRWSLDHLFLDQEGVPTLVEVKRSTDTRIRREVVGQMLDYAANGVKYWPLEELRTMFQRTCEDAGVDPGSKVDELTNGAVSHEHFWTSVKTNLKAGRIRMIFVADEIPDELKRVVEFLNEQMDPAEVYAVEIKQYVGPALKTLVPRLIGQTAEAEDRKRAGPLRPKRKWDEDSFFRGFSERGNTACVPAAKSLLDWARDNATRIWWGEGQTNGSFIPVWEAGRWKQYLFAVYTGWIPGAPYVQLQFQNWAKHPAFEDPAKRVEMIQRLNGIAGVALTPDAIDRYPTLSLAALQDQAALATFVSAMKWAREQFTSTLQ